MREESPDETDDMFEGFLGGKGFAIHFSPGAIPELLSRSLFGDDSSSENYNFASAHFNYMISRDFSSDLSDMLDARARFVANRQAKDAIKAYGWPTANSVVAEMLNKETNLDVAEERIVPFNKRTRIALDALLSKLVGDDQVALPVPNWHFWDMGKFSKGDYSYAYFDAFDEGQLVEEFGKIASKKDVKALVLLSPTNPLFYNISEAAAKEIEAVALKNGVVVVVDDVLRGTNPVGQRNSFGEYFSQAYVVEGFSKRFGELPLGKFSYVLIPEGGVYLEPSFTPRNTCLEVGIIQAALKHSTEPAIEELKKRNKTFDEGLRSVCPEAQIVRPSESYLISLVRLPSGIDACELDGALESQGVSVYHSCKFIPHEYEMDHKRPDLNSWLRITVGMMSAEKIREGAVAIGSAIHYMKK
ncbi:hypothetical protein ACFLZB_02400 [Nanoarchaeota archaeon]